MNRDLLFDVTPYDRSQEPELRMWTSVYDIPPGTVTKPLGPEAPTSNVLYITRAGRGWWLGPSEMSNPAAEIALVEGRTGGWTIDDAEDKYSPYREVMLP